MRYLIITTIIFLIISCASISIPDGLKPVKNFEVDKYLGKWYEIARLNHSFEEDLIKVTANYTLNTDGTIKVFNRGYNISDKEWSEAEGKAQFVGKDDIGRLEVSFFGPFYGGYNIIDLDKDNYQWAIVAGPSREYLWILSRTAPMKESLLMKLLLKIEDYGYRAEDLIFVEN
jgi:apolipoprotein D and lipocalin family protein